jgi:hypothetical protein
MAILPLQGGAGIDPEIISQLHRELVNIMSSHSKMEILDRALLEKILKENELDIYADDSSRLKAGEVLPTDYYLYGSVTKSEENYALQFQIADTANGTIKAAYSGKCSSADLQNFLGVRLASMDLIQKMGVTLSGQAKTELAGAAGEEHIKAQTAMAKAFSATNYTEGLTHLYEAEGYDPSFSAEAAAMIAERNKALGMLAAPPPAPMQQPPPMPQLQPPDLKKPEFIPERPAIQPLPPVKTGNLREDAKARIEQYKIDQENKRIEEENERIRRENERIRKENEQREEQIRLENERIMEAYRRETARMEEAHRQEEARIAEAYRQENVRRDTENKERWVQLLKESEEEIGRYLAENPVFELVYTPKVKEGELNYEAETMALFFDAALVPRKGKKAEIVYRSAEKTVQNLQEQIAATGRASAWGLDSWPEKSAAGNESPFVRGSWKMTAEAELLDETGNILGRQHFTLSWGWVAHFTGKGMTLSADTDLIESVPVEFPDVPVDAITDTLTIAIVKINGMDAAAGTVSYSSADRTKWEPVVRADRKRAAEAWAAARAQAAAAARQKAAAEARAALNPVKHLLPHQVGIGTTFTMLTLSLYNNLPFFPEESGKMFWMSFDYGCDFSFNFQTLSGGPSYFSFYPNAHIGGLMFPFFVIRDEETITSEWGLYCSVGGGLMQTTYGGRQISTPVWEWKVWLKLWRFDFAFSGCYAENTKDPAFTDGEIYKFSVGLRIPY